MKTRRLGLVLLGSTALGLFVPPVDGGSLELRLDWYHPGGGNWIGERGFFVRDLDGDGVDEIVAATMSHEGINTTWYVHDWDGETYQQEFAAPPELVAVTAMAVAQADGDAALEVLAGRGALVTVWDGIQFVAENTIDTQLVAEIQVLALADIDVDGRLEMVCADEFELLVLDYETGAVEHSLTGLGFPTDLQVGQLDGDASLELVIASGEFGSGFVVDGTSGVIEWERQQSFGDRVRLGDLNADASLEIVGGYDSAEKIEIYDRETEGVVDQFLVGDGVGAIAVADMDGSGLPEIIYASNTGGVHILDAATGATVWSVFANDVRALGAGSADGDPEREVVWSAGSLDNHERIYVGDTSAEAVEWQSYGYTAVFANFAVGGREEGGAKKVYLASGEVGFKPGLFIFDATTRDLETFLQEPEYLAGTAARVAVAQLDSDPAMELLFTTDTNPSGDPTLLAIDGETLATEWQYQLPSTEGFAALAVGDVDGDSEDEVVAAIAGVTSGSFPVLDVLDADTGTREWRSPVIGGDFDMPIFLRLADVDSDPGLEIVLAHHEGSLRVLSADDQTIDLSTGDLDVWGLDTPDLVGDAKAEIVIGDGDGELSIIDPVTGLEIQVLANFGSASTLRFHDYTGDANPDAVLSTGGELVIYDVTTDQVAASINVSGGVIPDLMQLEDLDGDDIPEILVSADADGLLVFRVGRDPEIFVDGFESGDTSAWSSTVP